jgi:hypothetical protein
MLTLQEDINKEKPELKENLPLKFRSGLTQTVIKRLRTRAASDVFTHYQHIRLI